MMTCLIGLSVFTESAASVSFAGPTLLPTATLPMASKATIDTQRAVLYRHLFWTATFCCMMSFPSKRFENSERRLGTDHDNRVTALSQYGELLMSAGGCGEFLRRDAAGRGHRGESPALCRSCRRAA